GTTTTTVTSQEAAGEIAQWLEFSRNDPKSHTYADEGTYTVTTTIKDDAPGTATTSVQAAITVNEADVLSATATALGDVPEGSSRSEERRVGNEWSYAANTAQD